MVHGSAGSLTVAEQLTAAAVTKAKEQPRPAPEPPSVSPDILQAEQVTAEVLAPTASLVEVVATDEEPEAQVPATKPVVEGAPPGVPAALAPEPVPAPSSEVGPASVHESSAAASGTAALDIVPRSEQGQPIADTPLLLGGLPLCRVVRHFSPSGPSAGHHEMHIAAGEEVALQWEQPLEEGAYWAWVWRIARTPVEPGYVPLSHIEPLKAQREAEETRRMADELRQQAQEDFLRAEEARAAAEEFALQAERSAARKTTEAEARAREEVERRHSQAEEKLKETARLASEAAQEAKARAMAALRAVQSAPDDEVADMSVAVFEAAEENLKEAVRLAAAAKEVVQQAV